MSRRKVLKKLRELQKSAPKSLVFPLMEAIYRKATKKRRGGAEEIRN